jgi:hypothetical protein
MIRLQTVANIQNGVVAEQHVMGPANRCFLAKYRFCSQRSQYGLSVWCIDTQYHYFQWTSVCILNTCYYIYKLFPNTSILAKKEYIYFVIHLNNCFTSVVSIFMVNAGVF